VREQDCRTFNCARCHQEVMVCRSCDRGNRYCARCARLARAEKQRIAGALYQKTEAGRLNHKVRQERYRGRLTEKVTHHGDLGARLRQDSAVATLQSGQESRDERRDESSELPQVSAPPELSLPELLLPNLPFADLPSPSQRCCDFCGRPCRCAVRAAPAARLPSIHHRGARLPVYRAPRRY
jgi:hypothetical protein